MTNICRHLSCIGVILLASCGSDKVTEGVIEYDITYPYQNTSSLMLVMLPGKMTMKFKDGKFKTVVSKGRSFRSEFIADCRKKKLVMTYKAFSKKLLVELSEREIKSMLGEFPRVTYLDVKDSDTLAGFRIRKKVAVFEDISFPEAELWYTDEIGLENPNWCYPYSDIKGVLLQYEMERYGIRTHLKASKFTNDEVNEDEFELPSGFRRVTLHEFEAEVKKMLDL